MAAPPKPMSPREIKAACDACKPACTSYRDECNGGKVESCFRAGVCMCQCKLNAGGCGSTEDSLRQCIANNEAKLPK